MFLILDTAQLAAQALCSQPQHVYCLETEPYAPVVPTAGACHVMFVSRATVQGGFAALSDAVVTANNVCRSAAQNGTDVVRSHSSGSYAAWLSLSSDNVCYYYVKKYKNVIWP